MRTRLALLSALVATLPLVAAEPPAPFGPLPQARQIAWHEREVYAFLHFSPNTFTDKEWGYGDEDPKNFHPTAFDAEQIVGTLSRCGFKGVILTCKHHDGFCLWPTKTTKHSIAASGWKDGQGDVVREIADACKRHGVGFGVYLSPWDRNHPEYGRPAYVQIYRDQLRELLTQYGPLFEVWHDGANGGDGYYGGTREKRNIDRRTYYGWPEVWSMVHELQPMACIFSDAGPQVRWVGNEHGVAGETCWATLNAADFAPGEADQKRLNAGDRPGTHWIPAECDVSIRPGWFFHEKENDKVRTPDNLLDLYFKSVGRGASFLLNVPPDRRGLIHENDAKSLEGFADLVKRLYAVNHAAGATASASHVRGGDAQFGADRVLDGDRYSCWATDDGVTQAELTLDIGTPKTFSVVRLRENIKLGQRVEAFAVDQWKDGRWAEIAAATSIGYSRLLRFPPVTTGKVRLRITQAAASPCISEFSLFTDPLAAGG